MFDDDLQQIKYEKVESPLAFISELHQIQDVRYSLLPIEYPATSDEGIAYVFNVEQWDNVNSIYGDVSLS
jgi:hypothetical protein